MIDYEFWRYTPVILATPAQIAFVLIFSVKKLGGGFWIRTVVGRALFFNAITLAFLLVVACSAYLTNFLGGLYSGVNWNYANSVTNFLINTSYWTVCVAIYYQLHSILKSRFTGDW